MEGLKKIINYNIRNRIELNIKYKIKIKNFRNKKIAKKFIRDIEKNQKRFKDKL